MSTDRLQRSSHAQARGRQVVAIGRWNHGRRPQRVAPTLSARTTARSAPSAAAGAWPTSPRACCPAAPLHRDGRRSVRTKPREASQGRWRHPPPPGYSALQRGLRRPGGTRRASRLPRRRRRPGEKRRSRRTQRACPAQTPRARHWKETGRRTRLAAAASQPARWARSSQRRLGPPPPAAAGGTRCCRRAGTSPTIRARCLGAGCGGTDL